MYKYRCIIIRVIDGDTVDVDIDLGFGIWLKKQRIRLYGVDTPESRTRDLEEKKYGLLAKEFVKSYLQKDSEQILQTRTDERGKFGRILGEFIINNTTINQLLIENHQAVKYTGQSKELIKDQHLINRNLIEKKITSAWGNTTVGME